MTFAQEWKRVALTNWVGQDNTFLFFWKSRFWQSLSFFWRIPKYDSRLKFGLKIIRNGPKLVLVAPKSLFVFYIVHKW